MKFNNKNLIHLFSTHLRVLDFYKASTLCNEFMVHRFITPELGFDTHVMIMPAKCCYNITSHVIVHPMLHRKI